ncbi:energy-coupling factor ABC transporter ATP-binding protein [Streptomyces sp. DH37]|uniref:energy-coupling factor ABC transporter ATP-binding protein n=1 Tax=Streptomyces sp. DH37 TaxID=3040122 RepID=UPI002441458A|nr:energy-coupling factor ABC transporter ATP-binding protein [Streptomyces sp. DH37]MDG9702631.1 energy-coupling factor ABC transporter ATP-binding protein [Streptomyces sp. DH37]
MTPADPGTGPVPPPSPEVSGLAHAYPGGHQTLFGVGLAVACGERVALPGPTGTGKTTLVLHLDGILTGGAGSVTVAGPRVDPSDRTALAGIRRRVGIVFQDPDDRLLMPAVREDVAFGPAAVPARRPEILVPDEPPSDPAPASRREPADILRSLDVTVPMVTHDLPHALEPCPRSAALGVGVIAADGRTRDLLCDEALMRAHRLEPSFGFDPRSVTPPYA